MTQKKPPRKGKETLDYLQALRGIAAMVVVLYHGSRFFLQTDGIAFGDYLFQSGGVMGVDLFFVISGFIMVYTTTNNNGSLEYSRGFFIKRFARVWPTYVILTLIHSLFPPYGPGFFFTPGAFGLFAQTLTFVPTEFGTRDFAYPILSVGWTLNYEMYFYLIFGLSLLFGRGRWIVFFGWIWISMLWVGDSGYTIVYIAMISDQIIWFFVAGVIIGLVYLSEFKISSILFCRIAVLLSGAFLLWQFYSGYQVEHGLMLAGLSILPFVLVISIASKTLVLTPPKWMLYLGDISYSLYLVHTIVQKQSANLFKIIGLGDYANGFFFLVLTTALSIGAAAISYRYLERGVAEYIRHYLNKATKTGLTRMQGPSNVARDQA